MPFGLNEVNYALKRIYPKFPPQNIASWRHPFLVNCPKDDSWTGEENFKQGVEYGNPQGIGGDFAKAQAASQVSGVGTKGKAFDVARKWKNGFANIQGKAIVATSNSEGAFFKAVKKETDNGIRSFGDRLSVEVLNGDGNGWIGRVQSISTLDLTLGVPAGQQQKWHATRFKEGMTLNSSTTGLLANITAFSAQVTKVNYKTGIVTVSNTTNLTAGDFLAASGDFEEGGLNGVNAWIPLNDPSTSDNYFGVNRSVNPTLLSGNRLQATAATNPISENALDLAAEMSTCGSIDGETDGYLHPLNWNRMVKELGAQIRRTAGGTASMGFAFIEQETALGTVNWFPEPDMEADRGLITKRQSWVIRHAMGFPHLNEDDGNAALRSPSADAIEVRLRSAANLFNLAPGNSGVFPVTPPT